MTIGLCINYCVNLEHPGGMRYAGVETGIECNCGAEGAQYDQYGERDVSECSKPCAGNSSQTCGSEFRIAVYDRKCSNYMHHSFPVFLSAFVGPILHAIYVSCMGERLELLVRKRKEKVIRIDIVIITTFLCACLCFRIFIIYIIVWDFALCYTNFLVLDIF